MKLVFLEIPTNVTIWLVLQIWSHFRLDLGSIYILASYECFHECVQKIKDRFGVAKFYTDSPIANRIIILDSFYIIMNTAQLLSLTSRNIL